MKNNRKAGLILFSVLYFLAMEAFGTAAWFLREGRVDGFTRSALTPASWVFFLVWTVLFGLLAAAFVLLRLAGQSGLDMLLFGAANALWTVLFFVKADPMAALVLVAIMVVAIFVRLKPAFEADVVAGWLLVPYALWLCFALALTYFIAFIN